MPITWTQLWENDVPAPLHEGLVILFTRAYPHSSAFTGRRSWSGAIPETRIVGTLDGRPIAHVGVLRRFLRTSAGDHLLVGDIGLVAVDPDFHRQGIGLHLLRRTETVLHDLGVPFGFVTCGAHVAPFYRAGGWQPLDGQVTRMIDKTEPEVYRGPTLALPVRSPMTDWPHGQGVDRNGLEV